jgi:hypothetical protein
VLQERVVGSVGEYRLIEKRTYLGYPYVVWEKPLPRTNDELTKVVVYLYPSSDDAQSGTKAGGTGFIVRFPISGAFFD